MFDEIHPGSCQVTERLHSQNCHGLAGSLKDCFPTALAPATKGTIRKQALVLEAGREASGRSDSAVLWN